MKYTFFCSFLLLLVVSCDMLESHPYEVKVKRENLNRDNIQQIERICQGKDTIRFVWMGDVQRAYDEAKEMVKDINSRKDIDFVMNGGDMTDFGLAREYEWVEKLMDDLRVPHVSIVGNHDLLGNGKDIFKEMYGELNFSFIVGHTKIICLNTNALEFDYSEPVPDYHFMEAELKDTLDREYYQTIVTMHAHPFGEQFDNNTAHLFQYFVRLYKNILFCTHAHTHQYSINDYFDDGILYHCCASAKKRNYIIFTVSRDHYTYESIWF